MEKEAEVQIREKIWSGTSRNWSEKQAIVISTQSVLQCLGLYPKHLAI